MKKRTKMVLGVAAIAAVGVAGYFGYKKYKASQTVTGLGAFTDGYADYNARVAARYWKRQRDMYNERIRMAALRGY